MNRKGQFSIIAALLVAVVLVTTVITTYSIIRNSLIQDQPQIMSSIDETNLAIKSVLGYTVGYYGAVLRVTGDSSYANTKATGYLQTGLENIATTHPDWGTSFNLTQKQCSHILVHKLELLHGKPHRQLRPSRPRNKRHRIRDSFQSASQR